MEDNEMTLTLILELPTATEATYAIEPELRFQATERDHRVHVVSLAGQMAPPSVVDSNESEPTWEDASWQ
jgi:hypothetical protein